MLTGKGRAIRLFGFTKVLGWGVVSDFKRIMKHNRRQVGWGEDIASGERNIIRNMEPVMEGTAESNWKNNRG